VALLKDSTLGYVVSYPELVKQGNNLLIQTYLIVAVIYVVVNVALSRPAVWLERRMCTRVLRNSARAEPAGAGAPTMA
jgi:glutamate transport system permease protein